MANRNAAGFGLIPQGCLGSTPATGGQSKYVIVANYATSLYNGTTVKQSGGYVITAQAAITNTSIGILNGVFYNAATTLKPTWSNHYVQVTPANSEDITAFVYDNPLQLYVVSTDKLLAQAGYLETYDMNASAGSTTTGKSSATLDIDDTSADAATWRLLRLAEDPSNSDMTAVYTSGVVVPNLVDLQP